MTCLLTHKAVWGGRCPVLCVLWGCDLKNIHHVAASPRVCQSLPFRGTCCAVLVRGANVLGCSGDDPLESLNLSLGLHWIALTCHLLFAKAAVVDTVWIIEEEARFLVLTTHIGMLAGEDNDSRAATRENGRSHLHHGVPAALA